MLRLILLLPLLVFSGPPVPVGDVAAKIADSRDAVELIDDCILWPGSPLDLPSRALVTVEVHALADGNDQQAFTVSITTHAHEDVVACLRDQVAAWGGVP